MDNTEQLVSKITTLENEIKRLKVQERGSNLIRLTAPLTSTDWNGDRYSTTAKTKIDLSAVFSVPAGVSAVLVLLQIRDSASSTSEVGMGFAPNDTADQYSFFQSLRGMGNNYSEYVTVTIPCDANGDIYYQITASGNSTMDVWLTIWGYWSTT